MKWENWAPYSQFFAFGADDKWKAMGVNHAAEIPTLQFFLYTDKDDLRVLPVATDLRLGQWCHLAAVSGKEGMRFYFNGVLARENTYPGSFAAFGVDEDNYLGKSNNRALSVAGIERIYGASAVARWSAEGNAADTWGGNDGTRVNSVAFAPGVVGQAFSFDGQGGYVELAPHIGDFGAADFSIGLWLWCAKLQNTPVPILLKRQSDEYLTDLHLDEAGRVQVELRSPDNVARCGSNQALSTRSWHHLALTRQGPELRLYLDGQLDTLSATERAVELMAPAPVLLGASLQNDRYFEGLIDEVSFINRALSAAEVQDIYNTSLQAWRGRIWIGRLKMGGFGLLVVVAVFSSVRYYTQRRESQRLREQLLVEERRARTAAEAANQAKSAFLANRCWGKARASSFLCAWSRPRGRRRRRSCAGGRWCGWRPDWCRGS